MVLPGKIVGTVVTSKGAQAFELDVPSGKVKLGKHGDADRMQSAMGSGERGAIDKRVRAEVAGVREVRIGQFRCPSCGRWVNVEDDTDAWTGKSCASCA
jgi:hypothetical protein